MNRPFWSRRAETDSCESIEPLLALYADRMASPEEMRRVDAHLPGCERCRAKLAWMQATHRALAARPVALPPADLHSRIAQAIAASSAVPPLTPGLLRPARSFALRSAYPAAASLTVLGIALSYSLWHAENAGVTAPQPVRTASAPPHVNLHPANLPPAVPPHFAATRPRVALATPEKQPAPRPFVTPRKLAPSRGPATAEHVAAVPLVKPLASVRIKTDIQPIAALHDKIASVKIAPVEKHQPPVIKALPTPKMVVMPKAPNAPLIARHDKDLPAVSVKIEPPVVVPQAPPPVQTASSQSRPEPDDFRAKLVSSVEALRSTPYGRSAFTVRQASTGAASAVQALESQSVAYYGAIHSPTAIK